MYEPSVVLYAREHWRIIRADCRDPSSDFVIVDSAGTELRREPSFDGAKAWIAGQAPDAHAPMLLRARRR